MSGFAELYHASTQGMNLPATLLLLLVVLYWFTVMFGVLDLSSLDVDLDASGPEGGMEGAEPSGFDALLEYFNIRQVPVSIVVSFFALSFWMVGVFANHALHDTRSGLLGLAVFILNVPFSAHVAKWVTRPMVPIFRAMRKDAESVRDLCGERVFVTSSTADAKFGIAEIRCEGAPITLNVRTEGDVLPKGTEAVILQHDPEKDTYLITPLEL